MRSFVRAAFIASLATAGFAALLAVAAPERLRRAAGKDDDELDNEVDADDLTDAEALAMLRELAHDLDFADLDADD